MASGSSRSEKIQDVLRSLRAASPDVVGAAVVSTDGFIVGALLPSEIDEELVSGMASAFVGAAERIAMELAGGGMEQTYVKGRQGHVILSAVGEDALLIVLTTAQVRLGLVFLDIKRRIADLVKLL